MSTLTKATTSLRVARTRALIPKIAFYVVLAVLCAAGLRAIVADPKPPPPPPPVVHDTTGEESFAEGFVRTYLTWDPKQTDARERELATYLPTSIDRTAGLQLPPEAEQRVRWTAVTRTQRDGPRVMVTVAAELSNDARMYLAVPVVRDRRGFLYVADFPSLVGPPPLRRDAQVTPGNKVADGGLATVVTRALRNYLAGAAQNLRADLTPDAVVTMPAQRMRVTGTDDVTWVRPGQSVELKVQAVDDAQITWTLHYSLLVSKTDRWYVRSIEPDPTYKERLP